LDFKNVFLFSCNEGVLPKKQFMESFLPLDVRRHYGMPSPADREAIFAYYFYRCLQQAKSIHLMFNNGEKNIDKNGEISRYLQQLQYHFEDHAKVKLRKTTLQFNIGNSTKAITPLRKVEWMNEQLMKQMVRGLSPSAIDKWLLCKRDFFYRYILGLGEQAEVEETMESSTLGTVVHDTLEALYGAYVGQVLTETHIEEMHDRLEATVDEKLAENYKGNLTDRGINFLSKKVIQEYVRGVLKAEKKRIPTKLIMLETSLEWDLEGQPPMKLKGMADRIDEKNGVLEIIDYKTGNVTADKLRMSSMEKLSDPNSGKPRQLLIYAMLAENTPAVPDIPINPGIISTRKI
ncbi:MAG: PD-(D/E)XK nuclease family protein, partial [Bacteroidota bacterium]